MKKSRRITLAHCLQRMAGAPAPLLCRPPGRQAPLPAYILITPRTRLVEAVVERQRIPGTTVAVHRGTLLRIPIPATISGDALLRWCHSHSVQALMRRVCDGWRATEDARGAMHGTLDESASDALIELLARAERDLRAEGPKVQTAFDWPESQPVQAAKDLAV